MSAAMGILRSLPTSAGHYPCGHEHPKFSYWDKDPEAGWPKVPDECAECKWIENDTRVREYITCLGYTLGYDSSRSEGIQWWEICDDDGCIIQMSYGINFMAMVRGLKFLHENPRARKIPDDEDYEFRGHGKAFREVCRKVWEGGE